MKNKTYDKDEEKDKNEIGDLCLCHLRECNVSSMILRYFKAQRYCSIQ